MSEPRPLLGDDTAPRARPRSAPAWLLTAIGLAVALPTGAISLLINTVVPLAAVVPKTMQVTGPVEADARAIASFGAAAVAGLAAFASGVHRLARGRWSAWPAAVIAAAGAAAIAAALVAH